MAVLGACQSAMVRLVGQKPTTVFSSLQQTEMEIAELATEVAVDLMKANEWRALTKIHTITGNGVETAFDLPVDYDRMALGQGVNDAANWLWGYSGVDSLNEWMTITSSGFQSITPGWWFILGGQMQFSPAPTAGSPARFAYVSRNIGRTGTGTPIDAFTKDDDEFLLGDRLLTLGIIWRWKAQKGLEYAEDMTNFEKAFSEDATHDKGARVIRHGSRAARSLGARTAWPWALG